MAVQPINQDGSLAPLNDLATLSGTPGPHRTQQESSHPHHCPFDRAGRVIVVPDKGLDKIFVYRLDTARAKLVAGNPSDVASRTGAGPRRVDFHPTQPYAWVEPRTRQHRQTPRFFGLDPSGTHVYAANQNRDTVVIFRVHEATGALTSTGETVKVASPSTIAFR